jgi:hypothetical protein
MRRKAQKLAIALDRSASCSSPGAGTVAVVGCTRSGDIPLPLDY